MALAQPDLLEDPVPYGKKVEVPGIGEISREIKYFLPENVSNNEIINPISWLQKT